MILFIIFMLIALAAFIYSLVTSIGAVKNKIMQINYPVLIKKLAVIGAVFVVTIVVALVGACLWNKYAMQGYEWVELILGGILFFSCLYITIQTFIVHYYGKSIPEKINKWLFRSLCIAWPLAIVFFFIFTNGFAAHLTYPLINGFSFEKGWVTPLSGKPNIAFYALCILAGAVTVYFLCDHKFYIQYGKHGILESTFLVAFPAGIIGSRIFYCIGVGMPIQNWWRIFDGGLTILGGAITGIVVGVAWFMWRNKGYSIWVAVDIIVPTILIAQMMGRWGNFFNVEVHGMPVDENVWSFLPGLIWGNAHYGVSGSTPLQAGQIYVPLFLIEGMINFFGYFVLAHLFGRKLRKYTEFGDLAFGYVVWYGLVRVILEPLRDKVDQMNTWSWYWCFVFVIVGTLLIVANHVIRRIIRIKKNELVVKKNTEQVGIISTFAIVVAGCAALIPALSLILTNSYQYTEEKGLTLDGFNWGLILLMISVSILLCLAISIPKIVDGRKRRLESYEK